MYVEIKKVFKKRCICIVIDLIPVEVFHAVDI